MRRLGSFSDQQLEEITDVILAYARLDFASVPTIRGDGPLDAVAAGLQMLGAELRSAVVVPPDAAMRDEVTFEVVEDPGLELRTPLTGIIERTERMLTDGPSRAELEQVLREANRLKTLVEEMLSTSRG